MKVKGWGSWGREGMGELGYTGDGVKNIINFGYF